MACAKFWPHWITNFALFKSILQDFYYGIMKSLYLIKIMLNHRLFTVIHTDSCVVWYPAKYNGLPSELTCQELASDIQCPHMILNQFIIYSLSHYPTLGFDIQGFRVMGLSVQYWPQWFHDFPAIWLAVQFRANGAHLGNLYLARKNPLCVWNKLFLGEIKFSQRRTRPVKSLGWQTVPMQESTNEWKNLTIFYKMELVETQW